MNKKDLIKFFTDQFSDKETYIKLAEGHARYKMDRGSFTTKDRIKNVHHLVYSSHQENDYLFSDGQIECHLTVTCTNYSIKIKIKGDRQYNRFTLRLKAFPSEHIYGCGEQYTYFDLKGQKVKLWVSEHQQSKKIAKKFLREKIFGVNPAYKAPYKNHQTYFVSPSFFSSNNYFLYFDSNAYGQFDFKPNETIISFRDIPSGLTILVADSPIELISRVTKLVNYQPKLPDFVSNGAILASQGGTEVMLRKYHKAKANGTKITAIWCQDWSGQIITKFGSQVFWNWELDDKLYDHFDDAINELKNDGVKFLGYINTFVKENTRLFNYAKEHDYLVKKHDKTTYLVVSTTFNAGIVDLTSPKAYNWYKEVIKKNMIDRGLSGWMADFGEYLPTDSLVYGGDAEKLHNLWPTLWAKCNYDAIKEKGLEGKIFIFSRAAFGDTIQFTNSMWSGDQHVDFSDEYGLGSVIPSTLSMVCSGVGINHSDIGGYTTMLHMKRTSELFIRWAEMNVFTPVYRCHEGNRPQCNVQFDDDRVLSFFSKYSNLFFKLKDYREHVLKEYYNQGIPFNRPLFFHFNDEKSFTIQDEFMMGSELLVAPIVRPNVKSREVYLPNVNGKWIDLLTGNSYEPGYHQIEAPMGKPLAFYVEGTTHKKLFESIREEFKL